MSDSLLFVDVIRAGTCDSLEHAASRRQTKKYVGHLVVTLFFWLECW